VSESISTAEPDFAAFIAIDWADREHAFALQIAGSTRRETGKFEQKPNAVEAWDADILLDLITLHRNRLRRFEPDDEPTRKLQLLVEKRRQMVDMRTANTNRLTDQLKLYFPQVLDWFHPAGRHTCTCPAGCCGCPPGRHSSF
jgi:hypothetical protein